MSKDGSTLAELQEFRRRKLAEREAQQTSEESKFKSADYHETKASKKPETRAPNPEDAIQKPPDFGNSFIQRFRLPAIFQRILDRIYYSVIPDHLVQTEPTALDDRDGQRDPSSMQRAAAVSSDHSSSPSDSSPEIRSSIWTSRYLYYATIFLAWTFGFALMIRFGWGAVYFTLSIFIFIAKNLNDRRKPGAPSAYSVFNPDFERIEGTVDAERLTNQMFMRF